MAMARATAASRSRLISSATCALSSGPAGATCSGGAGGDAKEKPPAVEGVEAEDEGDEAGSDGSRDCALSLFIHVLGLCDCALLGLSRRALAACHSWKKSSLAQRTPRARKRRPIVANEF